MPYLSRHSDKGPLVSVITPTFNHARFVGSCVESVINQTIESWELIVIDDGSTDCTREVIRAYKDARIRYFRQPNVGIAGLATTYNRALSSARAEVVAILEGDDIWQSKKLELQLPSFEDDKVVLSFGRAGAINDSGRELGEQETMFSSMGLRRADPTIIANDPPGTILRALFADNFIPSCTVMLRKRALLAGGGFCQRPYTPYVDYPTWLRMALVGRFSAVDSVLGFWRVHGNQYTNDHTVEMVKAASRLALDFYQTLDEETRTISKTSENELIAMNKNREGWALFERGRRHLRSSRRREARADFWRSLKEGPRPAKLLSLGGLLTSVGFLDLESEIRLAKYILGSVRK